ncbi:MAG: hypothetical protein ACU85U_15160 [Gammaproteobacteria bacterium]
MESTASNTATTGAGEQLVNLVEEELAAPVSAASRELGERLRLRYGDAVLGVLYYGSCFRTGTEADGILDIFLIVDDYASIYDHRLLAIANRALPPNVFYAEMDLDGTTLRTKYAVISMQQFEHRTSARCFHTFFWARFAQPCALTYARDAALRRRIAVALAGAAQTFIRRSLALQPETFTTATLWTNALRASYRTELRPEAPGAAARLVEANQARYTKLTSLLTELIPQLRCRDKDPDEPVFSADLREWQRRRGRLAWVLRRPQGKLINLLRIMKAAFTFDGGVDYVLWKIERHSGVKVEATPMLRRHPLLACWPTVWRLYRAGAFR